MNLPVLYLDNRVISNLGEPEFDVDSDDVDRHVVDELRPAVGDHVGVVDSSHDYFECEVVHVEKPFRLRIAQRCGAPECDFDLTVVQGICAPEKMDAIVAAATEIGASRIVPLTCVRGAQIDRRHVDETSKRWRDTARRVAMLSGQPSSPIVEDPINMHDAGYGLSTRDCVLVCYEQASAQSIGDALDACAKSLDVSRNALKAAVVVGPEGGFEQHEIDRLLSSNDHTSLVSLGPSILRVETAGVIAPAICAYELGGLH